MVRAGERAYIYAKICGIIGKSFVGKRTASLANVQRLSELDRLVFPDMNRELPERGLLPDLEDRITKRSVKQIIDIIGCFQDPPELLTRLVRSYEYADLKSALSAIASGDVQPPEFTDIGRFGTVKFNAFPDLKAMLKGTEFGFLLKEDTVKNDVFLQTQLDVHYYSKLWDSVQLLPRQDRIVIEKIIGEEISLRNAAWALRFRVYYAMRDDDIIKMLILINKKKKFAQDALASLNFAIDNQGDWARWKWSQFVSGERAGEYWKIDPRYFQNEASLYLYRKTYHALRARPFTLDSVFCYIRLKQFEEDVLTSIAEGFGFNMTSRETLNILEVV